MKNSLKYTGDEDRAMGLSGMAMAMYAYDGSQYITALSLDNDLGEGIELSPEFQVVSNPRMSAKIIWHTQLKNFEMVTAMLLGNAMCRSYIGRRSRLDAETSRTLKELCHARGHSQCELDADEIERLYAKTATFLERLFTHTAVQTACNTMASTLKGRRRLSTAEIMDILRGCLE